MTNWLAQFTRAQKSTWLCNTLEIICIVASGINEAGEMLKLVEIIYISSKSSKMTMTNHDTLNPRAPFNLIVVRSTIPAIENETTIEVWENIGNPWKEAGLRSKQ